MSKHKLHSIVLRNVQLSNDSLFADKASTLSTEEEDHSRKLFEKQEAICFPYPFFEVDKEELAGLRTLGIPSLILKVDNRYLVCHIEKAFSKFAKMLNTHQCSFGTTEACCNRVSAASDEEGGCQKVREGYSEPGLPSIQALERYPWITQGYEIFGGNHVERFVVLNCEHHEDYPTRCSPSRKQTKNSTKKKHK